MADILCRGIGSEISDVALDRPRSIFYGDKHHYDVWYSGFYKLYQIDKGHSPHRGKESDRVKARIKGLRSPWGVEAALCAHFHWTREYLLWGISWQNVQMMLLDMPTAVYEDENVIDSDDPDALMAYINSL